MSNNGYTCALTVTTHSKVRYSPRPAGVKPKSNCDYKESNKHFSNPNTAGLIIMDNAGSTTRGTSVHALAPQRHGRRCATRGTSVHASALLLNIARMPNGSLSPEAEAQLQHRRVATSEIICNGERTFRTTVLVHPAYIAAIVVSLPSGVYAARALLSWTPMGFARTAGCVLLLILIHT
ncbi:hypothetical protein BDR04DRAFT_502554 [Suillus decipiens]|nr:hypothetical protein BDR04DRAFT_502554 [Suillus decipiens]